MSQKDWISKGLHTIDAAVTIQGHRENSKAILLCVGHSHAALSEMMERLDRERPSESAAWWAAWRSSPTAKKVMALLKAAFGQCKEEPRSWLAAAEMLQLLLERTNGGAVWPALQKWLIDPTGVNDLQRAYKNACASPMRLMNFPARRRPPPLEGWPAAAKSRIALQQRLLLQTRVEAGIIPGQFFTILKLLDFVKKNQSKALIAALELAIPFYFAYASELLLVPMQSHEDLSSTAISVSSVLVAVAEMWSSVEAAEKGTREIHAVVHERALQLWPGLLHAIRYASADVADHLRHGLLSLAELMDRKPSEGDSEICLRNLSHDHARALDLFGQAALVSSDLHKRLIVASRQIIEGPCSHNVQFDAE